MTNWLSGGEVLRIVPSWNERDLRRLAEAGTLIWRPSEARHRGRKSREYDPNSIPPKFVDQSALQKVLLERQLREVPTDNPAGGARC